MNHHDRPEKNTSSAFTIPELVGRIYDAAPIADRRRMLEYLMRPLSALALVGVCHGIFAKIWFRSGWSEVRISAEDAQTVQGIDVTALADYLQQASSDSFNGLVSLLSASPMITYSAATAVLVSLLALRIQSRRRVASKTGGSAD